MDLSESFYPGSMLFIQNKDQCLVVLIRKKYRFSYHVPSKNGSLELTKASWANGRSDVISQSKPRFREPMGGLDSVGSERYDVFRTLTS